MIINNSIPTVVINDVVTGGDSFYVLGKVDATGKPKSSKRQDYALCQMRSWLSPKCSTHLSMSGTDGAHMLAHCDDENDEDSYLHSVPDAPEAFPQRDWKDLVDAWQLSLFMNAGLTNSNASRDLILTQMIVTEDDLLKLEEKGRNGKRHDHLLPSSKPTLAEGLAALASSTLVVGSLHAPLRHYWEYPVMRLDDPETFPEGNGFGVSHAFNASIVKQEYTSTFTEDWQRVFFPVLAAVLCLNIYCLAYFLCSLKGRPLTDYTDPVNLFALAINSPPPLGGGALGGSCGGGAEGRDLKQAWKVAYSEEEEHFYFEEAGRRYEGRCEFDREEEGLRVDGAGADADGHGGGGHGRVASIGARLSAVVGRKL